MLVSPAAEAAVVVVAGVIVGFAHVLELVVSGVGDTEGVIELNTAGPTPSGNAFAWIVNT
jgi:hypothetical protein